MTIHNVSLPKSLILYNYVTQDCAKCGNVIMYVVLYFKGSTKVKTVHLMQYSVYRMPTIIGYHCPLIKAACANSI